MALPSSTALVALSLRGAEYSIPRPTVLQLDIARLNSLHGIVASYAHKYRTAEAACLAATPEASERHVLDMQDSMLLVERTTQVLVARIRAWLAASPEGKALGEAATDEDLLDLCPEIQRQLTGGEALLKNL